MTSDGVLGTQELEEEQLAWKGTAVEGDKLELDCVIAAAVNADVVTVVATVDTVSAESCCVADKGIADETVTADVKDNAGPEAVADDEGGGAVDCGSISKTTR